jgi:3-methyl-2-oxobutanoate hydroxymethyltransferase
MKSFPSHPLTDRLRPPVVTITAYDYPSARLCEEAGMQLLLVGDSVGMVVAGHPDTTAVTLAQIAYHTEMVRRGAPHTVIVSDLPIHTYDSPDQAVVSGRCLLEAGADAVKLEGGIDQLENLRALGDAGIPVCGHLGMLPQRVREEGGYKKKGKTAGEADRLIEAALAIEEAGVFAMVLESVVASVAREITRRVAVPTIGIGSGPDCDGQVRVLHDVTGAYPWFVPPFATVHGNVAEVTRAALQAYLAEVSGTVPKDSSD